MAQILNLDKLETRREKVIILGGKEHVMKTLTVKEYIVQMKEAAELNKLVVSEDLDDATKIVDLTIDALLKLFPTITRDQFESLNMDQLTAIRKLAEEVSDDELETEDAGEVTGKAK
jgi:uncharacterized membrane protein YjjP (DUF1212 family)